MYSMSHVRLIELQADENGQSQQALTCWSTDVLVNPSCRKKRKAADICKWSARAAGHSVAATKRTHYTPGQVYIRIYVRGVLMSFAATVTLRVLVVSQLLGRSLEVPVVGRTK